MPSPANYATELATRARGYRRLSSLFFVSSALWMAALAFLPKADDPQLGLLLACLMMVAITGSLITASVLRALAKSDEEFAQIYAQEACRVGH